MVLNNWRNEFGNSMVVERGKNTIEEDYLTEI